MTRWSWVLVVTLVVGALARPAAAEPIEFGELLGFVHADGGLLTRVDAADGSFFASVGGDNLGTFGWTYRNSSSVPLSDVRVFGFLDADIDRDVNTAFNEFGEFLGLALPPSAPAGAIAAAAWEIDEPGFLFGDVVGNLEAGRLDNSNAVPASTPDDVSLALGFSIGTLFPGDTLRLNLMTTSAASAGLRQTDPDSGVAFTFNGYATVTPAAAVPEPGTAALFAAAIAAGAVIRRRRQRDRGPGE